MRAAALLVALAVSPLLALAGCVTPAPADAGQPASLAQLPAPLYAAQLTEGVVLPSFDSTPLSMQVYRPVVAEGERVPVIVNFSPYWGNLAPAVTVRGDNFSAWLIDTFVPRGYAVVLASVRGTGESGGCFEMGGRNEMEDTAFTVEWLAAQEWSNGKVAAIAKSYDGTVANMAAVMAPEGLATIVPVSGITDWYEYLHRGGLPYGFAGSRMIFNPSYYLSVGWGVTAIFGAGNGQSPQRDDACRHFFDATGAGLGSGLTGDYTAYWTERNYTKDVASARASMLFIHGLQDWNVNPAMIDPWYNAYPGPKKAMLGQWDHLYPTRDDFGAYLLRWFESELKGVDNGIWSEPDVQVQADDCVWRYEADWPPSRAEWVAFHPTADGALAAVATGDGTVSYRHDPANDPQPTGDGGDRVVFLSEPFATARQMAGVPMLRFAASSDRPVTAFAATLYDVSPEGEWREVNRAFLHASHRESLETSQPLTPGEEADFVLRFYPQDTVFAAGHSVGLMIASQNTQWVLTPPTGATNTLRVGAGASLELPIVAGTTPMSPQPTSRVSTAYPYADWNPSPPEPCLPAGEGRTAPAATPKPGPMQN